MLLTQYRPGSFNTPGSLAGDSSLRRPFACEVHRLSPESGGHSTPGLDGPKVREAAPQMSVQFMRDRAYSFGSRDEPDAWAGEIVRCVQACQRVTWTDLQPSLLGYWVELIEAIG